MSRFYCVALSALLCLLSVQASANAEQDSRTLQRFVSAQSGHEINTYEKSYALLIGNSRYQDYAWSSLESIPHELDKVSEALSDQGFDIIRHENLDTTALRKAMREFVIEYGAENNRLLVFYSGHGYTEKRGTSNVGYLVPTDAPDPVSNIGGLGTKALSMGEIITWAKESPARHIMYVFDSCFSGSALNTRTRVNASKLPHYLTYSMSQPVRQFITAGTADQPVPAVSQFANAFVNGLKYRKADLSGDGFITGRELGMYIHQQVSRIGNGQIPQFGTLLDPRFSIGEVLFNGEQDNQPAEAQSVQTLLNVTPAPKMPPAQQPSAQIGLTAVSVVQAETQVQHKVSEIPARSESKLLKLQAPKKKRNWLLTAGGLVLVGALIGASSGDSGDGGTESDSLTVRIPAD